MSIEFNPNSNDEYCIKRIQMENSEELFGWLSKRDDIVRTLGEIESYDATIDFLLIF